MTKARLALALVLLGPASPSLAKVFLTQEEALKLALSGGPASSALAVFYVATKEGRLAGTAYFDTHVVRTLPETLMVVVTPAGTIARIEILSFSEPEDYLPRPHWYAQFPGKGLDDELSIKRGIRPVSGATAEAARRVLALHQVLSRRVQKAP